MAKYDKLITLSLLGEFLAKAKEIFASKSNATTTTAGLMSPADKEKLDALSPASPSELVFEEMN